MVITITQSGYIKSLPLATYRQQQRGGRGVTGMDMKDGDFIEHLFVVLLARLPAVLLQPRQGLPLEGLRAARGLAHGEGPRAGQHPAAARGRAHPGGRLDARLRRDASTSCSPRATAPSRRPSSLAYNTPIKADGIIAINIRDDDELLAVRAVDPNDEIIMVSKAGPDRALRRVRRARDGPRHDRRARHGRRQGRPGDRDGRRARRHGPARRDRERLRQAHADRPVPQDQPRRQRRQDDRADREKGRPRRRARRARAPGAGVHQRRRDGPAHRRRRHLPAGPLGDRRAGDEPQGRGPRQRGRARRRHRRRGRGGRGTPAERCGRAADDGPAPRRR